MSLPFLFEPSSKILIGLLKIVRFETSSENSYLLERLPVLAFFLFCAVSILHKLVAQAQEGITVVLSGQLFEVGLGVQLSTVLFKLFKFPEVFLNVSFTKVQLDDLAVELHRDLVALFFHD